MRTAGLCIMFALLCIGATSADMLRYDFVVNNATNLVGVQTDILYDISSLKYLSASEGGFFGLINETFFMPPNETTPGVLPSIVILRMDSPQGVNGSGIAFSLLFNGTNGSIIVNNTLFSNSSAQPITVNFSSSRTIIETANGTNPLDPPTPYNATYSKSDLSFIIADGLGTTSAEFVFWLDVIAFVWILSWGANVIFKLK